MLTQIFFNICTLKWSVKILLMANFFQCFYTKSDKNIFFQCFHTKMVTKCFFFNVLTLNMVTKIFLELFAVCTKMATKDFFNFFKLRWSLKIHTLPIIFLGFFSKIFLIFY
jgi:hypothetical protein